MLLSSVILVLQETLEAALLISVLMAVTQLLKQRITWLPLGLGSGLVLAFAYAINMGSISEWLDYAGQEVMNALLQLVIALAIVVLAWTTARSADVSQSEDGEIGRRFSLLFQLCAAIAIILAITREGSEIIVYLGGFLQQEEKIQSIMTGSGIGFSIGVSVGFLLFYGLMGLPARWGLTASIILLALFAGNMLSQSVLQLTQVDWIPSSQEVWDSSRWISENSLAGQLLYALVGYEATPSLYQFIVHLCGVVLVLLAAVMGGYCTSGESRAK